MKPELTQKLIKALLDYNNETGVFIWRKRPIDMFGEKSRWKWWNTRYAGKVAGTPHRDGCWLIAINDVKYRAHRLAFLYFHGVLPRYIDHIDHNPLNNKISNLRGVTHQENHRNQTIRKNNTSGIMGVYWRNDIKKWAAQIMLMVKQ